MIKLCKITYKVDGTLHDDLVDSYWFRDADWDSVLANIISKYCNKKYENNLSTISNTLKSMSSDSWEMRLEDFKTKLRVGFENIQRTIQTQSSILNRLYQIYQMNWSINAMSLNEAFNLLQTNPVLWTDDLKILYNDLMVLLNSISWLLNNLSDLSFKIDNSDISQFNHLMYDNQFLYQLIDDWAIIDLIKICKITVLPWENQFQNSITVNILEQNELLKKHLYDLLEAHDIRLKTLTYEVSDFPLISRLQKYWMKLKKTVEIIKHNWETFLKLDIEKMGIDIGFYSSDHAEYIREIFISWIKDNYPDVNINL